jgi:hypothetical protein
MTEDFGYFGEQEFLVCYDYGMGGLWAVMIAPSKTAISKTYPELLFAVEQPGWMTDEYFEKLRSDPLWLDSPPTGILNALLADRDNRRK